MNPGESKFFLVHNYTTAKMTTKVKKGRKPMYHVEAEYWQKAIIGMNQVLERLGLAMSPKKHRLFGTLT